MQIQKTNKKYKTVSDFFKKKYKIPEDWDYVDFSEVVKVNPIIKLSSKIAPYVPMDAVSKENPHVDYYEERDVEKFSNLPKFQKNDVLFASITPSTENGKVALMDNFEGKGIGSSELTILRPTSKVDPRYLYYYVKSHRIREFAISQMMGTTGRQRVPDFVFKKDLKFELPPLKEQQKIALILSNLDSLMEINRNLVGQTLETKNYKKIKNLEKIKRGLMQKLLTGQIRVKV